MTPWPPRDDERCPESTLPIWISDQLVAETKAAWSPKYGRTLTTPEAIEILLSFGRLLDALEGQES